MDKNIRAHEKNMRAPIKYARVDMQVCGVCLVVFGALCVSAGASIAMQTVAADVARDLLAAGGVLAVLLGLACAAEGDR